MDIALGYALATAGRKVVAATKPVARTVYQAILAARRSRALRELRIHGWLHRLVAGHGNDLPAVR